jgi:glycosyltransferase involved in cell wall biosynthesis
MKCNIFIDHKEDNWESMYVYANMLIQSLRRTHNKNCSVHVVQNARWLSACLPKENRLFRLGFRYGVNPLFAPFSQGDINHIVDQSNAHLLRFIRPQKTVITCHDTIVPFWDEQFDNPSSWKRSAKRYVQHWRMNAIKKAGAIIAVSHAAKQEIIKNLHIQPEKIFVVYEAVEIYFKPQSLLVCRDIKEKYHLPDTYILHVGTNADYKNIPVLLNTFKSLLKIVPSLYLIKVGSPWTNEQLARITQLGIHERVIHLGFLPRKSLPAIYTLAACLYYPSIIEGFGFPVLEAMSCGCPVVTSDAPALVEISDSAAIHTKKDISKQIVQQIREAINNDKMRYLYSERGLSRSKYFSPTKMANQTFRVYQKLAFL